MTPSDTRELPAYAWHVVDTHRKDLLPFPYSYAFSLCDVEKAVEGGA